MVRRLEVKSNLEKVIEKGGNVSADKMISGKEWSIFGLRLREDVSIQIDNLLENRIGMSKTAWILEAIQEKIKRSREE